MSFVCANVFIHYKVNLQLHTGSSFHTRGFLCLSICSVFGGSRSVFLCPFCSVLSQVSLVLVGAFSSFQKFCAWTAAAAAFMFLKLHKTHNVSVTLMKSADM